MTQVSAWSTGLMTTVRSVALGHSELQISYQLSLSKVTRVFLASL